ncbi:MAG TPA: alpha/beta hydrolase family protein [Gemmatimonadaceae bacterium]|nr:alpha/beta hydrolase family protein [Gemmatimonadaceae bacterium]
MSRITRSLIGCAIVLTGACARRVQVTDHLVLPDPRLRGSLHEDVFHSAALGAWKHLMIYLPPSYASNTTRRYPVAYYLHGLGGSEADWVSKGAIDGAADSLFAGGTPEMILVMPDGDDGWYTTWTTQVPFATCADTLHVESPGRYCVQHERYDEYIARDVVAYVDANYRTLADRAHRGIGGLSMGGYGAITIALHYPDVFAAAASHSGVVSPMYVGPHPFAAPARYADTVAEIKPTTGFWGRYLLYWGTDLARWEEADPAHIAATLAKRGARLPALFFDDGTDDPFVDQNRALDAALTTLGIAHSYAEWPGAHNWRYWSTHVPQSLAWMSQRIGR